MGSDFLRKNLQAKYFEAERDSVTIVSTPNLFCSIDLSPFEQAKAGSRTFFAGIFYYKD